MNKTTLSIVALLGATCPPVSNALTVISSEMLCIVAGDGAPPPATSSRLYGTDLGITYERDGRLELLFGDTWTDANGPAPTALHDDAFGAIGLTRFPDGDAVEAYCKRTRTLPVAFDRHRDGAFTAIDPGVAMDGLKTPLAAFANGRTASDREFAAFVTGAPLACSSDSECSGFVCDTGLGYAGKHPSDSGRGLTLACLDNSAGCTNQTLSGHTPSGFCRDPGSSIATPEDDGGRRSSVLLMHKIGVRSRSNRAHYATQDWPTSRFTNLTFATSGAKVMMWGRPWWNSINADGRTLHLYFAYVDMPNVDAHDRFGWRPHYFSGLDAQGTPRFSQDSTRAAPLDLSGGAGSYSERYDIVAQMSVRFIAQLDRWVMLYGGGTQLSETICAVPGANCDRVNLAGAAIRMRTAAAPWGPWSAPIDVVVGGDPRMGAVHQYASGGLLHHPLCTGADCAPHTPPLSPQETGALYGANLIEQWTEQRTDGTLDLYWNVSTWNPYRVVLMKTRVRTSDSH